MAKTIYVINGPNLNLLGTREPEKYGGATLADTERLCRERAQRLGFEIDFHQSNHEGALIDAIQDAWRQKAAGLVINPGAYGHTSVGLLDAVLGTGLPTIEIHVTNIHARESFRHHTYLSRGAKAVVCGFGIEGYGLAIEGLVALLAQPASPKR